MVDETDVSMNKEMLKMHWNTIKEAMKNKGVIFILLLFLCMVVISFAIGYMYGFDNVPSCPECFMYK